MLKLAGSLQIMKVLDVPLEVLLISVLLHPLTDQSEDFLDLLKLWYTCGFLKYHKKDYYIAL